MEKQAKIETNYIKQEQVESHENTQSVESKNLNEAPYLTVSTEDKNEKDRRIELLKSEIISELEKEDISKKSEKPATLEIKKEFIDEIIASENIRYKSPEASIRAQRIDKEFPATAFGKILNKYVSQQKNLDYVNPNPPIHIVDWLEEGEGGHYRQQPELVSRSKDFINVTNKADPEQLVQILRHEYNHMVTEGESNFSSKYKKYIRNIFLSNKELKSLKGQSEYEFLFEEPYKGAGPIYKYLTSPAEINAYIGTNLRDDLLSNGIIKNIYDKIDMGMIEGSPKLKNSNCARSKTPVYKIYLSIVKDKKELINWLNNYAI